MTGSGATINLMERELKSFPIDAATKEIS